MVISTIKSFSPAPGHLFQVQDNKIVKDFAVFVGAAADVQEIADENDRGARAGFGEWATGVELCPGVGSGVEGVNVVGVGSGIGFATVDYYYMVSPEGGTMTAAFCGWGR